MVIFYLSQDAGHLVLKLSQLIYACSRTTPIFKKGTNIFENQFTKAGICTFYDTIDFTNVPTQYKFLS